MPLIHLHNWKGNLSHDNLSVLSNKSFDERLPFFCKKKLRPDNVSLTNGALQPRVSIVHLARCLEDNASNSIFQVFFNEVKMTIKRQPWVYYAMILNVQPMYAVFNGKFEFLHLCTWRHKLEDYIHCQLQGSMTFLFNSFIKESATSLDNQIIKSSSSSLNYCFNILEAPPIIGDHINDVLRIFNGWNPPHLLSLSA